MTRAQSKSRLAPPNPRQLTEEACVNWAAVARRFGVSRSALSHTLHGRRTSRRMRVIVAGALGTQPAMLWGKDWSGNGRH